MQHNDETNSYQNLSFENEQFIQNLKKFLYNLPWTIDIFDSMGKLIWANKSAQKYWGDHPENMVGVFNFISEFNEEDSQIAMRFKKALFGNITAFTAIDYHSRIHNASCPSNITETIFTPLISSNSEVTHVIAINILASRPSEAHNNQESKNNEDGTASVFLKNISHELRTPLNWIIGFSDLIKQEQDIMKVKAYNEHINKGGKLMLSTIEMLIDLSLIEKDVISIKHDIIPLNQILNSTKDYIVNEIENTNKNITVRIKNFIENNEQFTIVSDLEKLKKVLNSLIQNALKFTKEGYIEVGCLSMKDAAVMFYIKDSGIGMSRDIKDHISDIFSQDDKELSASLSGQGLGLSIVKKYVKALDGNIWLDSESKKGSTFFFTIMDLAKDEKKSRIDHTSKTAQLKSTAKQTRNI